MINEPYIFTVFELEIESDYDNNYQEIIGSGRAVYTRRWLRPYNVVIDCYVIY